MKNKLLFLLKLLLTAVAGVCLAYLLFMSEEVDYNRIIKAILVFIGCLYSMVKGNVKPIGRNYKRYEEAYKDFLEGTFIEDRKSYRKLRECAVYHNRDQYDKAYKTLDALEKKCARIRDYVAVYSFKGLCYAEEGKHEQAVAAYEKVLQYDIANAIVWSNLGLSYKKMGKAQEAHNAYANAIMYDPNDAYPYLNMAEYFVDIAEADKALQYGLKAIELNSKLYDAMGMVAMAYTMKGDAENAEKYCKMYGANGGDGKKLRNRLATL